MTFIFIIALVSITLYKLDDISNLLANYFNNTETTSVEEKNQYAKEENGNYELALARHHGAKNYKSNPEKYTKGKYKDYYDFILPSLNKNLVYRKNVEDFQIPKRERKDKKIKVFTTKKFVTKKVNFTLMVTGEVYGRER